MLKCTPMEAMKAPAYLVKEALFWAQAKAAGYADKANNERNQQEGMNKAFGR